MRAHTTILSTIFALSLSSLGCGGGTGLNFGPGGDEIPPDPTWSNEKPVVVVASPGALSVGEPVTILGQKFVDSGHGQAIVRFKGTFFDENGGTNEVDFESKTDMVNTGKLRWTMWPNVVFDKTGDHLGRFVGHIVVLNQGNDGSQLYSEPFPVAIDIKPSIIPRVVRPINAGCASVIGHTLEDQPMQLSVEVIGLRPASQDAPITFYWTFMSEHWNIVVGKYGATDVSSVRPESGPVMLEDKVTSGRTSTVSDGGSKMYLLKIASDLFGSGGLKELRTGNIPEEGNNLPVSINVAAVDASGKQAKAPIRLVIHRQADMSYDGTTVLAERYEPQMVSDCMPGGNLGKDVNYHEATSESRARSMSFNWNASVGGSISPGAFLPGALNNPWALGINFSIGFGVNVNESASSDKSKSLSLSGHILPGEYGAFYRQTSKIYRIGKLVGYTVCGQQVQLGDAILTDWMWTPDLASGSKCPPPTNLQPAEKFRDDLQ